MSLNSVGTISPANTPGPNEKTFPLERPSRNPAASRAAMGAAPVVPTLQRSTALSITAQEARSVVLAHASGYPAPWAGTAQTHVIVGPADLEENAHTLGGSGMV